MKRPAPLKEKPTDQDSEDLQQQPSSENNHSDDHQVTESEKLDDTTQSSEMQSMETAHDTKS
jgi:hypothetical protein